jgi:hypothetical protein
MAHIYEKGMIMKPTQQNPKKSTAATGFFAMLCSFLHIQGIGPSKIRLLLSLAGITTFFAFTGTALAAIPETPETGKANPATITATTATLEDGVLNPHAALGEVAEYVYRFKISATECEGESEVTGAALGDKEEKVLPVELMNLQPNSTYTFCLFERNLARETSAASPPAHFTTKAVPPEIIADFSEEVSSTSATLGANINPNNEATKYRFEYSESATGETLHAPVTPVAGAPPAAKLEGFEGQVISASTGAVLTPGTTYYYRVVAENKQSEEELKPAEGKVEQFTTVAIPHTDPVSAIAGTTATFNGDLTPLNPIVAARYHFLYNVGAACAGGSETPSAEAGTGTGGASAATPATGLEPDTIYTVCFVTSNHFGSEQGSPVTFRTLPDAYVTDVASSSVTLHAVLDPEGSATTYRFQYGPTGEYGSETSEESIEVSGAGGPVSVEAHLHELTPGSVYHYRVIASNAAHETFASEDRTFTTLSAGTGGSALTDNRQYELVSPPDKHGALVEPIDAYGLIQASGEGNAFTYITSSPTESQPQGNANAAQILATRGADGWSDRDIATPNEASPGVTVGTGQEYRLFSSDLSRAIFEDTLNVEVSGFSGFTTFPGEETSPHATEYTAFLRENFACPSATCYTPLLTTTDVTSGAKYGEGADDNGHTTGPQALGDWAAFTGATPDLNHVVLNVDAPLTKATSATPAATGRGLYEWSPAEPSGEQLQLVSVLPAAEGGGPAATPLFGTAQTFGLTGTGAGVETRNAISNDGARIVWSSAPAGEGGLYMRDTGLGETVRLDTVQGGSGADPGATSPEPVLKTTFNVASSDGSTVFFTDTQRLTADSRGGYNKENSRIAEPDLYACNMVQVEQNGHKTLKCNLTDLTPDGNPGEEHAAVQGTVLAASDNGTYVYFVANGVLGLGAERGATTGNCENENVPIGEQACNLYVEHYNSETGKWEAPRFIAAVSGADDPDWTWGELGRHTSGASPDGRYLAFMSERGLTGYDSTDANSGESDEEVYLYDAVTSKLVCASCDPTGARPVGEELGGPNDGKSGFNENMRFVGGYVVWPEDQWLAANIPAWVNYAAKNGAHQPRYLSNSGRLFFNSRDALVPQDVNRTWDVYEYEPPGEGDPGEGDCTTFTRGASDVYDPRSEGCVGLISSGESSEESAFLDASESGGDVFFMTLSQLVGQDVDHSIDVYDAHECTAKAPCFPPAAEVPPPCTTEASCKASPEPPPSIYGEGPSETFNGPGNLSPQVAPPPKKVVTKKTVKCRKGFVKKKVKKKETCVKKKSKKSAHKSAKARH